MISISAIVALKTKHDTPKYGLIYHASLVGQAKPQHKGKVIQCVNLLIFEYKLFLDFAYSSSKNSTFHSNGRIG